ncbi:MAG: hypothetical protein IPP14_08050 [Planctomycetes bacterium]|nr:hypothetical protein [Planctomycetota bacterium]
MVRTISVAAKLALLSSLLLAASCSNVETPDLKADVEREKIIPPGWQPVPLRVGIAPMRAALELDERRYNVDDTKRWVLTPDEQRLNGPGGLNQQLIATLRDYHMFEYVATIDGASASTSREDLQNMALRQGLDVVVVPTVKRQDVGYVDSNAAYGWNMFVWWMVSPIFSWFIADEDFDANLHIDMRMYPTSRDAELLATRLQPPQTIVRSLDDWDHGFNLFAMFSTPGYMGEDNWKKVGGLLMPIAENEAKKSMLRFVTQDLSRKVAEESFREAVRRRVGLVIGVDGTGQPPVPLTRFASADAESLASQLLEAENDRVPEAALRTLLGPRATRRSVEQAADELATMARGNDDLFVVFTGVGMLDDTLRPTLVLAQPGGQKAETIALADLLDRLAVNKPRTITLLLDCSFAAPGDRRCATSAPQLEKLLATQPGKSLFLPLQAQMAQAGIGCVILSATDGMPGNPHGMKALEIEDLGHGLFSAFAVEALAGKADTSGDRQVTVEEFRKYVGDKVKRIAELEGESQRGYFSLSDSRKGYTLPAMRR